MTWIFLHPRTPLLFRPGRSWGVETAGLGMSWPMPHQILGAARTAAGDVLGFDWDFSGDVPTVVGLPDRPGLQVTGVWLARATADGTMDPYWQRPADLVALPSARTKEEDHFPDRDEYPLRPGHGRVSPAQGMSAPLAPLFPDARAAAGKPLASERVPPFFDSQQMQSALLRSGTAPMSVSRGRNPAAPRPDVRVHVSIQAESGTAEEGALFSTRGIEMPVGRKEEGNWSDDRFGLLVQISGADGVALAPRTWRLGGKGGVADAESTVAPARLAQMRDVVVDALGDSPRFRWVLTGPARFARGWCPGWVGEDALGEFPFPDGRRVPVRLVAAAMDRPVVYSGWNLQAGQRGQGRSGGAPRPSRRFVPSGAVYFFERTDGGPAADVAQAAWLAPIPDGVPSDQDPTSFLDAACAAGVGLFGLWEPKE